MSLFKGKNSKTENTEIQEPKSYKKIALPKAVDQHAFSGRAYARHAIAVLVLIIISLLGLNFFLLFNQHLTVTELNKKNFSVYREKCDGSIEVSNISTYQTAPDEVTVRSLAWNVVRLIKSAGSGNADVVYDEASRLMTSDMRQAFQVISDTEKSNLKRFAANGQGVYRVLEGVKVKLLEKEDLPPGAKVEISQYDVVVSGSVRILTMEDKQQLGPTEEFSIRVKAVPLKARTEANPWGLLVSSMDILDPNKSLRRLKEVQAEKEKNSSSGSTIGDALGLNPDKMKKDQEKINQEEK